MGRKQIKSVIPEIISEKSVFFKRCKKSGKYKKITMTYKKNLRDGKRILDEKSESEQWYRLVSKQDQYDDTYKLQNHDGSDLTLYFKLCEVDE